MAEPNSSKRKRLGASLVLLLAQKLAFASEKVSSASAMAWSAMMARIMGTVVPEVEVSSAALGATAGAGVAEGGCAALILSLVSWLLVLILVVSAVLIGLYYLSHKPASQPPAATTRSTAGIISSAPGDTTASTEAANSSTGVGRPSLVPFDPADLQSKRLRALTSGDTAQYNRLIQEHLALYKQHHVDPCRSGFFPQGCSHASGETNADSAQRDQAGGGKGGGITDAPAGSGTTSGAQGDPGRNDQNEEEKKAVRDGERTYIDKGEARKAFSGKLREAANRFFRGATGKSRDFKTRPLPNGEQEMEYYSPAKNAGYGKRYIQEVDSEGNVLREYKETIGPDGRAIETKWVHGGPN